MIEETLASLWSRVNKGDVAALHGEITRLAARRLSRAQKLKLATLANDALMGAIAYRLLYRYAGGKSKASSAERLQYGRALSQLDLVTEAMQVLLSVNPKTDPMVGLALGFLYSRQWDYAAMVSVLNAGHAHPGIGGRERLRHAYLLANALFTADGERKEPERLLMASLKESRAQGYWDIEVQTVQILVAHHLWDHEWKEARHWLEIYELLFKDHPAGRLALTREKWWRVLDLHTSRNRAGAIRKMEALKAKFFEAGLFSQVRNCEYYQAMCFEDKTLAARLYFGSPFPFFKQRVLRDCKLRESDLPAHEDFVVHPGGHPLVLDTTLGTSSRSAVRLKPGQAPHRLLQALIADHYVPASVYELCSRVYPEEFFNPVTSPPRLAQLLLRLREWLAQSQTPLQIEERSGRYHLSSRVPLVVRVHGPRTRLAPEDVLPVEIRAHLELARASFGCAGFSAAQLAREAHISRTSALNVLRALVAAGLAVKSGAGARTLYCLAKR